MWFAEPRTGGPAIGTVTLGWGPDPNLPRPTLQWLAVLPAARRRGIGSALLTTAESAAWDSGQRRVELETLSGWQAAVALYRRHGYQPIRPG